MRHEYIYEKFEEMFNKLAQEAEAWFVKGKNCIKIRIPDKGDYVFTYNGDADWRLETATSYNKSRKE